MKRAGLAQRRDRGGRDCAPTRRRSSNEETTLEANRRKAEKACSNEDNIVPTRRLAPTRNQSSNEESKLQRGIKAPTRRRCADGKKQTNANVRSLLRRRHTPTRMHSANEDRHQRGHSVPTRSLCFNTQKAKSSWSTRGFIAPPRRKDTVLPSWGVYNAARMKDGTSENSKLNRNPISAKARPLVGTQAQRICRYIEHPFPVLQREEHTPRAKRSTGVSASRRCSNEETKLQRGVLRRNGAPRTTPNFRRAKSQHPRPSNSLKATRHH